MKEESAQFSLISSTSHNVKFLSLMSTQTLITHTSVMYTLYMLKFIPEK